MQDAVDQLADRVLRLVPIDRNRNAAHAVAIPKKRGQPRRIRVNGPITRDQSAVRGKSAFAPGLDAAIQRGGMGIAQLAQGGGGQGRDLPELAADQDAPGGIGQFLVDAQFQLAARQMAGAGNMAGGESVLLPHIQQHQFRIVALHPLAPVPPWR